MRPKTLREVLTGFNSLNTVARDGAAGNVLSNNGNLVTRQRGSVLDDAEEEFETMKKAATILTFHKDGNRVLAVSRKDDPDDFGLPGGKVDPGEDPADAAVRELKEETGLDAIKPRLVYTSLDSHGYVTYTYMATVLGEIDTDESGVVKWVDPEVVMRGSFGEYNKRLFAKIGIT